MTPRRGGLAVDRDVLDICGRSGWDGLLDRFGIVVECGDRGADVQEGVVDRVFRGEW